MILFQKVYISDTITIIITKKPSIEKRSYKFPRNMYSQRLDEQIKNLFESLASNLCIGYIYDSF
jgi:hypothetical protein